jgi:multiple antibiotic resistance protein
MQEFHFNSVVFISFVALFPLINPIGTAFIVSPYFADLDQKQRNRASLKVSIYAFLFCMVSFFLGQGILDLFDLSVPVVKICGGIVICKIGWGFLFATDTHKRTDIDNKMTKKDISEVEDKLFYPITFPITTGAGVLSVMFTLSANTSTAVISDYLLNTLAVTIAILLNIILVFFFYANTNILLRFIGKNGEIIVNRLIAFLIFCVGLQIAITGLITVIKHNLTI